MSGLPSWLFSALPALLVVALLAGRRSKGAAPAAPPPPDAAWLVVMRDSPISNAAYFRVDVDGARAAVLKSRQYAVVALRPGAHELAVNVRVSLASDTVVRFEAAPAEIVVWRLEVPVFARPRLERVHDVVGACVALIGLKTATPEVTLPR